MSDGMTDSQKLKMLADWFDLQDDKGVWPNGDREVESDLRRIAEYLDSKTVCIICDNGQTQRSNWNYCPYCGRKLV